MVINIFSQYFCADVSKKQLFSSPLILEKINPYRSALKIAEFVISAVKELLHKKCVYEVSYIVRCDKFF